MTTRPTTAPTDTAFGPLLDALASHCLPARIHTLPGLGRGVHILATSGHVLITDHPGQVHTGWTARWVEYDDHDRISLATDLCSTHGADPELFAADLAHLIAPLPDRPPLLSSRARALAHTHAACYAPPQEAEALPVLHVGGLAIGVCLDADDGHAVVMVDTDTADALTGTDGHVRVRIETAGTAHPAHP